MTDQEQVQQVLMQQAFCKQHGLSWVPANSDQKVGIAENVKSGLMPLNGLRHPLNGDTTGWYIWAGGEPNSDPEFFVPLHVQHLSDWCPLVIKFLGLPPGWRFLIAGDHEEIWEDTSLLQV
jgi:hypothetical protein